MIGTPENPLSWDWPNSVPLTWSLPGHGKAGPDCGSWIHVGHLEGESYHVWTRKKACGRFECPECRDRPGGWRSMETAAILERLRRYGEACRNKLHHRMIHVVVSPPGWDVSTIGAYRHARERAYKELRRRGFEGGVVIFHHARLGSPRWNEGVSLGCRVGPHWHAIGTGWITGARECECPGCHWEVDGTIPWACVKARRAGACYHDGLDWVVKNLGVRESLVGTVTYILSHASQGRPDPGILPTGDLRMPRGPETVTWMGDASYNRLPKGPDPEPGALVCPLCKAEIAWSDLWLLHWLGGEPPPKDPCVSGTLNWRAEPLDSHARWMVSQGR